MIYHELFKNSIYKDIPTLNTFTNKKCLFKNGHILRGSTKVNKKKSPLPWKGTLLMLRQVDILKKIIYMLQIDKNHGVNNCNYQR